MKFSKTITMGIFSFLFGCSDSSSSYQKKDGNWFFKDQTLDRQPTDHFKPLNALFAKDDSSAFYRNTAIFGSDAASFSPLDEHHAKDKNHVYYCDTYRKGQEYFLIKHNSVVVIPDAESATFSLLKWGYAKDAKRVFFEGKHFPVAEAATFQVLESGFSKDGRNVYYHQVKVDEADTRSFKILDDHYAKDKLHVYFSTIDYNAPGGAAPVSKILAEAEPATFTLLGEADSLADARDKRHFYKKGVKQK